MNKPYKGFWSGLLLYFLLIVTLVLPCHGVTQQYHLDTVEVLARYSYEDSLNICLEYLENMRHSRKSCEPMSLQVEGKTISCQRDFPGQMSREQKRRYWDFFSSGASQVCVDRTLGMAIRDLRQLLRKPDAQTRVLVLTRDSMYLYGTVHVCMRFNGYTVENALVERKDRNDQWLTFSKDHKVRFELIRLECFGSRRNIANIVATVFDGGRIYKLEAMESWQLNP